VEAVTERVPLVFASESIADTWDEAAPLVRAHQLEVGHLPINDFAPDKERYIAMERAGLVVLYTARDAGGKLVGYQVFLVSPHQHYTGILTALQDLIYMAPEHRGIKSIRFIMYADLELGSLGVKMISRHSPAKNHGFGTTLSRMGYSEMETIFTRRIL